MKTQPALETARLILRPFTLADAPMVQQLAGAPAIAAVTSNIPHPYEDGMAEAWIGTHAATFAAGRGAVFAITRRENGQLCGCIGLTIERQHANAEMGYWIGMPFWGRGYCTEAARAVLDYAFEELKLHRVHASHFARNPASGRVMQKIGMTREGCLRQHIRKGEGFEDLEKYGILAGEGQTALQR
jgi:RimJ/RimL family protein N-acetyltransferase